MSAWENDNARKATRRGHEAAPPVASGEPASAAAQSASPATRSLLLCFARTYLVGAAFNTRGMQNIGLVFAMEPGLTRIYPDETQRAAARRRYVHHYNTHMFWTPMLVGVFLSLEDKIARGVFPATVLDSVKDTTVYTLSAIGDSALSGSLLVFWSLTTALLATLGAYWLAAAWIALWFVALQAFKFVTFTMGYKEGLRLISRLRQWRLIDWGQRLKVVNAVLLAGLLLLLWPNPAMDVGVLTGQKALDAIWWSAAVGGVCLAAWLVGRRHLSRELLILSVMVVYLAAPWALAGWRQLFG